MLTLEDKARYRDIFLTGKDTNEAVKTTVEEACRLGLAGHSDIFFYESDGPYGYMCNFYKSLQWVDGKLYSTNENFYQASKASRDEVSHWIHVCPKPFLAMRAGHSLRKEKGEVKENWDGIKGSIMLKGLRCKFRQNPDIAQKLLDTGSRSIHEASPVDEVWGVLGTDLLGRYLMLVRAEILSDLASGLSLHDIARRSEQEHADWGTD